MDDYERLYASLIANAGEMRNVPAGRVLELYRLLCRDGLPEDDRIRIRNLTKEFLRVREKALLEEMITRDEELVLIERGLPFEGIAEVEETVLTEQIHSPIQEPRDLGATGNERSPLDLSRLVTKYSQTVTVAKNPGILTATPLQPVLRDEVITVSEAREMLKYKAGVSLVDRLIPIARISREGDISKKLIDHIISLLGGNILLDIRAMKEHLGLELDWVGVVNILSCARQLGIRDLVSLVNPYHRLQQVVYVIRKDVSLTDILPQLGDIHDSLEEGHYSYYRISEFLIKSRRMPADHELFDPVIDTVFVIREDGTYVKEFFGPFEKRTRGYRFMHLEKLFSFEEGLVERALEQLAKYKGGLVIPIDVSRAPSLRPESPTVMYMLKCDEKGNVDLQLLKRELGLST